MDSSYFVIFRKYNKEEPPWRFSGPLKDIISDKLESDFSTEPWEKVRDLHQQLLRDYKDRYKFYHRKEMNSHIRRLEGRREGTAQLMESRFAEGGSPHRYSVISEPGTTTVGNVASPGFKHEVELKDTTPRIH